MWTTIPQFTNTEGEDVNNRDLRNVDVANARRGSDWLRWLLEDASNFTVNATSEPGTFIDTICEAISYLTADRLVHLPTSRLEEIATFVDEAAWDVQFANTSPAIFERIAAEVDAEIGSGTTVPMFDDHGNYVE
jgi:hypothetical protein